jgi:hypothetical protein
VSRAFSVYVAGDFDRPDYLVHSGSDIVSGFDTRAAAQADADRRNAAEPLPGDHPSGLGYLSAEDFE